MELDSRPIQDSRFEQNQTPYMYPTVQRMHPIQKGPHQNKHLYKNVNANQGKTPGPNLYQQRPIIAHAYENKFNERKPSVEAEEKFLDTLKTKFNGEIPPLIFYPIFAFKSEKSRINIKEELKPSNLSM